MLSNLLVKSNILHVYAYQQRLKYISAIDLHSIIDRERYLGISFDPSRSTLTPQQQEEWDAHFFFGDNKISLRTSDRKTKWIVELGKENFKNLAIHEKDLNEEDAFEWLWLLTYHKKHHSLPREGEELIKKLYAFLRTKEYHEPEIQSRLESFLPHALDD